MAPTASLVSDSVSLHQVRCFCATTRAGSFTGAAAALGLTQPAVADHIRKLERVLGVELFVRTRRGVSLTAAGAAFDTYASAVLDNLQSAVEAVADTSALRTGTLTFGLLATPEAYGVDSFASDFALAYPGLRLRLVGRNSSACSDLVRDGDLEAALVALPIDDTGLQVEPVVSNDLLVVSADAAAVRGEVTIERLAARPLVVYDAESGERDPLRRQLTEWAQQHGLRLRPRIETETMIMALRMVADGVGDTVLPQAATRTAYYPTGLHTGALVPHVQETLAIIRRRDHRLSPALTTFCDELTAHLVAHLD